MPLLILLAFIALPLLEIGVFIAVGEDIGVLATVGATIATAVVGTFLVRTQGLATLNKVNESLSHGDMPVRPVFDGACQLVAGALLLTPGFITDAVGLLLFVPLVRTGLLAWLISRMAKSSVIIKSNASQAGYDVDGEYTDVTAENPPALPDRTDQK